jgi:hypothetical protein
MLPIIIGGGTVIAALYVAKSNCSGCNSKFTWNEDCIFCNKKVCSDCGVELPPVEYRGIEIAKGGRCCKQHVESREIQVEERKKNEDSYWRDREAQIASEKAILDAAEQVEIFSKSYKGSIPKHRLGKTITSPWFKDKDAAERAIKIAAAREGCSCVLQVDFAKQTEEDGNYKYTTWRASGLI